MLGSVWWYMHLNVKFSCQHYVYSHLLEEEGKDAGCGRYFSLFKCKGVVGQSFRQDVIISGGSEHRVLSMIVINPKPLHCVWFNHVSPLFWHGSNYLICSLPELGEERLHAGVNWLFTWVSQVYQILPCLTSLEPWLLLKQYPPSCIWILDPFFNEIMFCFPSFKNSV